VIEKVKFSPLALGLLAALAILTWFVITVNVNYKGNWTGLFCCGRLYPVPPDLEQRTYRFENSLGYDGQLYRIVAHDPWLTQGLVAYSDAPGLRWRRIFVPAIAWALAFGNRDYIDQTYIFTVLFFCGLGVYALARWLKLRGRDPAGGLWFLLFPGTLVSMDRMIVDVALFALIFLCLIWDEEKMDIPFWLALAACALTRDLGVLVIGAFFVAEVINRRFLRGAWILTSLLPVLAWFYYVRASLTGLTPGKVIPEVATWAFAQFGHGIFLRMFSPTEYDMPGLKRILALTLDQVALIGFLVCVLMTFVLFRWRTASKLEWIGLAFAVLYFVANTETLFRDLFSWSRAYTPLLAAMAFTERTHFQIRRWCWIPMAAVTLRVVLQFGSQFEGILSALRK
jgi:hypothetical protein